MGLGTLQRHDFVWLRRNSRAWDCRMRWSEGEAVLRLVEQWVAEARPFIVTRQPTDLSVGEVALGLALPLSAGKARIALKARLVDIERHAAPPTLQHVLERVPEAWRANCPELYEVVSDAGPRVFGSAAMQAMTRLDYLDAGSDLDLLLFPRDGKSATSVVEGLSRIESGCACVRIDGEIVDSLGRAVSWREFHSAGKALLFKSIDRVGMLQREVFLKAFHAPSSG